MSLPDFTEFDPFNSLRARMGTDRLGFFELFEPTLHLTGIERSDLDQQGLSVARSDLRSLLDFTLVYKNSRVLIADGHNYHLAECDAMPLSEPLHIATSLAALAGASRVCQACLQKLQYQGYDAQKARKEGYSRQVLDSFSLTRFWSEFHKYPISEKRDIRKSLTKSVS
ncbi:hypothetical protein [Reinekea sp.]|jgi:hypothetical protein|uniref:hypothetical protein n=1 Tax=Reinekea sp. TaxID=1970455 RepID=UPI002A83D35A|nr:hypothetical protein [Reinekea sp.]